MRRFIGWFSADYNGQRYPLSTYESGDGTIDSHGYRTTLLTERGDIAAQEYSTLADKVRTSFRSRFLYADQSYLADVVDGPDGDDFTMRPNQIFAVSLPFPLVDGAEAAAVVDAVGRTLLTSYGLRSLSPDHPAYHGDYGGDQRRHDGAYHQGTVWTWLMGAYVEAHFHVYRDSDAALALLQPFEYHLRDAGLGSISEMLEDGPPYLANGCFAQAWGVAEVLRVWRELEQEKGMRQLPKTVNYAILWATRTNVLRR